MERNLRIGKFSYKHINHDSKFIVKNSEFLNFQIKKLISLACRVVWNWPSKSTMYYTKPDLLWNVKVQKATVKGADYTRRITACPSGFENLTTPLTEVRGFRASSVSWFQMKIINPRHHLIFNSLGTLDFRLVNIRWPSATI